MEILVVDDHKLFLEGISFVIQRLNGETSVNAISSYEEAFDAAEQADRYDLVLLDLNISGGDGVAILNRYNELSLFVPVVAISATDDLYHIKAALDSGASGFIPKTFGGDEMLGALQQVLDGNIFVPSTIRQQLKAMARQEQADDAILTKKQKKVLDLLSQGLSNKDIADKLFLTENTVKSHLMTLFKKLNVKNRTECVLVARERRLIPQGTAAP